MKTIIGIIAMMFISSSAFADLQSDFEKQNSRSTYGNILDVPGCTTEAKASMCNRAMMDTNIKINDIVRAQVVAFKKTDVCSADSANVYLQLKNGSIVLSVVSDCFYSY